MKTWIALPALSACVLLTVTCRASPPTTRAETPAPAPAAAPAPALAAAPAPAAAPTPTPAIPPRDQSTAVKDAEKRVRAYLAAEAAGRTVHAEVKDGPAGSKVVRAMIDGAYPGSGVRAAWVSADAKVYGPRSPAGLADWVRAQGWLSAEPTAADLLLVVDVLLFDALLAVPPDAKPTVSRAAGALQLDATRVVFPSQARQAVRVVIGPAGPATVTIDGKPAQVGLSAAEDLEAALAADDAAGMARGVQALTGTTDPRGLAALARVSAAGNESLAASALMAIGSSAEAAAALKSAWVKLGKPARDGLKAMATELYGAEFAARLD
ncbi:MAG: hypothetical protein R3F39_21890 [Myxococcota bacterium]